MNDRFKFRVYQKKIKKMFEIRTMSQYQSTINRIDVEEKLEDGSSNIIIFDDYLGAIKDCEIMQSTGLKDKNGKLIYEGDIVKIRDYNALGCPRLRVGEIKYGYGDNYPAFYVLTNLGDAKDFTEDMEVIGNIYENKEMLDEMAN